MTSPRHNPTSAQRCSPDTARLDEAELALANARRLVKHALRAPATVPGYIVTFRELDALLDEARARRVSDEVSRAERHIAAPSRTTGGEDVREDEDAIQRDEELRRNWCND